MSGFKPLLRLIAKSVIVMLAAVGAWSLFNSFRPRDNFFYKDDVARTLRSPDGRLLAELTQTRGGLGTVSTVRLTIAPTHELNADRIVYQTRDSDFLPPFGWNGSETLRVGLPCDRYDHVSNHADWSDQAGLRRVAVELYQVDARCNLRRGQL